MSQGTNIPPTKYTPQEMQNYGFDDTFKQPTVELVGYDSANNMLRRVLVDGSGNLPGAPTDATVTGTITSTQSVGITLSGYSSVAIQLTGAFGGTVDFEATVDGSNWFTVNCWSIPGTGLQQNAGNAGNFITDVGGFQQFRCRGNSVNSGTCTVNLRASSATHAVIIANNNPVNVNVQNFAIGQFGNQDTTSANLTSSMQWAGNFVYDGTQWPRMRTPSVFKPIAAVSVTSGTPVAIWTPASGKKFRIMGYHLSLSVAGAIILKDNTTEIYRTPLMAAGIGQASPPLGNGILSVASNNLLNADVTASGTLTGTVFGTEE